MSKCSIETQCKGNGTCCAYCNQRKNCDCKCGMVYVSYSTDIANQREAKKCDWFNE